MTQPTSAKQAVQASEERLCTLVECSSEGVVLVDHQGKVSYAGSSTIKLLGYTREELETRSVWALIHPDDLLASSETFAELARTPRGTATAEGRFLHQNGSWRWLEVTCRNLLAEPAFQAVVANYRDVTDWKAAEERVFFQASLLDQVRGAVVATDPDGKVVYWNRYAESLYQWTAEEAVGKSIFELTVPAEGVPRFKEIHRRVLGSDRWEGEGVVQRRDGTTFLTEMVVSPIKDSQGRVTGVVGFATDVSERKKTEEALQQSEERYRLLFESNPQPMWVYDIETLRFLAVNQAAVEQYGYSREAFLEMTLRDIRPREDIPLLLDYLMNHGSGPAGIWRHRKNDGAIVHVDLLPHSIVFGGRRAELVLVNDVTERMRLEDQFRQAQKMEAVGRLAGGVAHDFNNILTVIVGYSEALLSKLELEDGLRLKVVEIQKGCARAASLTRQLLAFSRQQVLRPKVLNLNALVLNISQMLRRLIGEDIELITRLAQDLGPVKADPGQLEQVLMNLVVNARDAMPRGGTLNIESSNVELGDTLSGVPIAVRPGPYVLLTVSDTGTGFDEATRSRLFEPFFTTKELGKGTGLGLSTVYGIVKQSEGYITVDSDPGRGATFRIYLPRSAEPVNSLEVSVPAGPEKGTETILLVEDEEPVRSLMRAILEERGYRVLAASDGGEALRIAERHRDRIDVLVTDVVMPGMGGRELASRLVASRPETKVLFVSGHVDTAYVDRGLLGQEGAFLQKPFKPSDLARKVRELVAADPAAVS
jgi:hypothetical protein